MSRYGAALLAAVLALVLAQSARAEAPSGKRMYAELGQTAFSHEESITTLELRWGSVTPLQPSIDFALPVALSSALLTTPELDLALPIAVAPGARVIPRAGLMGLLVLGGGLGGYAFGWNAGVGVVVNAEGPVLLRADYTVRSFANPDGGLDNSMVAVSAGLGWRY
jgi:hypothetical protein